jgi:hypothetical protein
MSANRFSLAVICATLAVTVGQPARAQSDLPAGAAPAKNETQLKISTPVEEVVQLSKSGVGDAVVLSYIENSDRPYRLNAQDIIKLRDEGVSSDVTTALIRRGAEQRQAAEQAYQQQKQTEAESVAAAPTYQTAPTETVAAAPAPVTYYEPARSSVSVTYFGTPRYNYYYTPSYYSRYHSYGYSPNYYYPPRVSIGFGYGGHYRHGGFRSSARFCR